MGTQVLKIEMDAEACCICGNVGVELLTPEEHDANTSALHAPLRTMLLQLNNNKVLPEGRICGGCAARAIDAYEFSSALGQRAAPPLSEKIRALRSRLHELTQKIDVFIVVGGPGKGGGTSGANAYSEDDIIMVEKEALAAAMAADRDDLEHAKNARGDTVYQCTVCPISFQRLSELRAHAATHPADALQSCWTCGAQFTTRDALKDHATQHAVSTALSCNLCDGSFTSQGELRRHYSECEARCPACGLVSASRSELSAHCGANHGRGSQPPLVCAACFLTFGSADLLSAHQLRHRQAKQYVCGYGDCVLRFGTRSNLMDHIRKCHAAEAPEVVADNNDLVCEECDRKFASSAALKRHQRVHQRATVQYEEEHQEQEVAGAVTGGETETEEGMEVQYVVQEGDEEGEVEYLEVETLEDAEYILEEVEEETDTKPDISRM